MGNHNIITPPEIRFYKYVEKTPSCWFWKGWKFKKTGYGGFTSFNRKTVSAHRFSYQIHKGKIPDDMNILHRCDIRHCVNPDHLYLGTQKENMLDMYKKKRGKLPCGEKHWWSKLNRNQVEEIKKSFIPYKCSQRFLAKKYGVSCGAISGIINGNNWKHLS